MFKRLLSYVVNDIIVHNLAHNKNFQRLALRIDEIITRNRTLIEKKLKDADLTIPYKNVDLQNVKYSFTNSPPVRFITTFVTEIRKELKNVNK